MGSNPNPCRVGWGKKQEQSTPFQGWCTEAVPSSQSHNTIHGPEMCDMAKKLLSEIWETTSEQLGVKSRPLVQV